MSETGVTARAAALRLLHGVLFDRRVMSELTDGPRSVLERVSPADRARAQSIAQGVLRSLSALDQRIDPFVEKPPAFRVRTILRIVAYELLEDGLPAYGVVNAAVHLAKAQPKSARQGGLVNAVGRKLAELDRADWSARPPETLPSWLAKPITKAFGAECVDAIAAAHQAGAPVDLSLRDQSSAAEWAQKLDATRLPGGSLRLNKSGQISALDGFDAGAFWVQDAAAAMPVKALGDVAGMRVLDLCAAPGGKTMQLAAAGAKVTALDISENRLARVRQNLDRTGLTAEVVAADALTYTAAPFDAILLDAPCSATGTIRRHPDLPHAKAGADLSGLFTLQSALIDRAVQLLKPGGTLIYCTCSLLPKEGEWQVAEALKRHDILEAEKIDPELLGADPSWATENGAIRVRPDYWSARGGLDGFYIAKLVKTTET